MTNLKYPGAERAFTPEPLPPQASHVIDICPRCGESYTGPGNFCTSCGANIAPAQNQHPAAGGSPPRIAARGFGQVFGLHPIPAVLTLAVNAMLFSGQLMTGGAAYVLALPVAVVLAVIVYRAQMKFYFDDTETALVKALACGLLTAIPTGLPAFLTVPSGVVGLVETVRRKVN